MKKLFAVVTLLSLCSFSRAQSPTPAPPEGMVYVPGGAFTMGTDERDSNSEGHGIRTFDDARPRHQATVDAFFLDKTEVTNAQYKAFCDAVKYPVPPHWTNGTFPNGQENFPVTRVSWWEANAYAKWAGKRLPTEKEWERAARGTDGRAYPWGEAWDKNRAISDGETPQPVGSKPEGASPVGALDMSGNVWEWTANWYEAYQDAPVTFPEYGTQMKVIRGGSFISNDRVARTYYRSVNRPNARSEYIGFRCAKSVEG